MDTQSTQTPRLRFNELQQALLKISSVTAARVIGRTAPTEIHIVATSDRPPKQIVRDVQSLATATFGFEIDHRIVSVVRLDERHAADISKEPKRPRIERVGVGSRDGTHWIDVTLRWPDGTVTEGTAGAGQSRQGRARGAAAATVECMDRRLSATRSNVEIDQVLIQQIGPDDWVLVQVNYYEPEGNTPLLGSAQVTDDVATASVKALLNAVNRKLLRA